MYWIHEDELYHHGILGMRWGQKNGPPYPLGYKDHSEAEKKSNTKGSLSAYTDSNGDQSLKRYKKTGKTGRPVGGKRRTKSRAQVLAEKSYKKHKTPGEASYQHDRNLEAIARSGKSQKAQQRLIRIEGEVYQKKLKDIENNERNKQIAKKVLIGVGAVTVAAAVGYAAYRNKDAIAKLVGKGRTQTSAQAAKNFVNSAGDSVKGAGSISAQSLKIGNTPNSGPMSSTKWLKQLESKGAFGNAKLLVNGWEGDEYALKHFWAVQKEQWKLMPTTLQDGIRNYTSPKGHYKYMNRILRGAPLNGKSGYDKPPFPKSIYEGMIKNCRNAMSKASMPEDALAHRGVKTLESLASTLHVPVDVLKDPNKAVQLIGQRYIDEGFGSFGNAVQDAWPGPKIHALIHKGANAMYVDPVSLCKGEHEILTQCGSNYIIKDVLINSLGQVSDIFVEMV